MSNIKGVITALVTPFKNGEVDYESFRRLVADQKNTQKVDGFVVNGTTGESPTLSFDEIKKLYEIARDSGLPVIVGTGSNSTAKTIELSQKVAAWKPEALLVVVPYYNKPPQRGLESHFSAIAKASASPILLYNVPGRTITMLEPQTVGALSRIANIVGIKDATGDMNVLAQTKRVTRDDFIFLSGDDATCVDFCAGGGHGTIAVASHVIGREMGEAIAHAADPSVRAAYKEKYRDLMKWLYCEANPIPVKKATQLMGLIDSAEMRLPLVELDPKFHKDLSTCLKNLGKI
ncbi:MAG: 4-hydroxy-tetrahydrodipicolinate synthase [Bdellovibrionales bacterium]|nr:4-hydroxy-tetrahydrodipicolinate synthase [Bdellovibrionales bacterium]